MSNGSTNARAERFGNIHLSNQCSHSALHVHKHYFTRACAFEVCTIRYVRSGMNDQVCTIRYVRSVSKATRCASDSRQRCVMVQQVCNATSFHYHDGVGQAAGMAQIIIRNTTSTVKCICPNIELYVCTSLSRC